MNRISALITVISHLLSISALCHMLAVCNLEEESSRISMLASWSLLASRTVSKQCMLFINHSGYGNFVTAAAQTKTELYQEVRTKKLPWRKQHLTLALGTGQLSKDRGRGLEMFLEENQRGHQDRSRSGKCTAQREASSGILDGNLLFFSNEESLKTRITIPQS